MRGRRVTVCARGLSCALTAWFCMGLAAGAEAPLRPGSGPSGTKSTDAENDLDARYYKSLEVREAGSSTTATRKQAIRDLPLAELNGDARNKAQRILGNLGLFRRLPTLVFPVEAAVYQHLLQNPDVAVSTWRAMEISRFQLKQTAPGVYHADAGDGSVGVVEVWKSTPTETLIYCDGAFKSPLVSKPLIARSMMRLTTRFFAARDGSGQVEHSADLYVEFPSQTVETVAKVISPVSYNIADRNFKQLSLYVHLMSQAMSRQPSWVLAISDRMDTSSAKKLGLQELAVRTHAAAQQRLAPTREPLHVEEILEPLRRAQRSDLTPVSAEVDKPARR